MRRREAGRGAAPAGLARQPDTRAVPGLPPGPLWAPARSWLTTRGSIPNAPPREARGTSGESGARRSNKRRQMSTRFGARVSALLQRAIAALSERMWRAGRRPRIRQRMRHHKDCVFRRAIPLSFFAMRALSKQTLALLQPRDALARLISCHRPARPGDPVT